MAVGSPGTANKNDDDRAAKKIFKPDIFSFEGWKGELRSDVTDIERF